MGTEEPVPVSNLRQIVRHLRDKGYTEPMILSIVKNELNEIWARSLQV